MTELLVAIAVIFLLLALALPTLNGVFVSGRMSAAGSNMRQIASAMTLYSGDANDYILPSRFNHRDAAFPGVVRSAPVLDEWHLRGTWADILWSRNGMGVFPEAGLALGNDYRHDSPDEKLYDFMGGFENPLRSPQANTYDTQGGDLATPYGKGARERASPGYFAANDFFNDDHASSAYNRDGPFTNSRIRIPERSMYLVDSFAGEVIGGSVAFCDVEEHL